MGSAVNVALPRIGGEFRMNAIALGWVVTSHILAAAIGLVPLGRLADMRGPKRVFVWGVVLPVERFGTALQRLNPGLPEDKVADAERRCSGRS